MSGTVFGLGLSQQHDLNGAPLVGCKLYLYAANTSTPVVSYKVSALTIGQENTWPIVGDANGRIGAFWLADGSYRARLTDSSGVVQFDELSVPVVGASTVTPPSPTDLEAVFVTGMPLWMPIAGVKTGWVRMNGRTIGSATSGASELANVLAEDLFLYAWANYSDTLCPVTTGRGASAAADWSANKKIAVLDLRGKGAFGLADMGNADDGSFAPSTFDIGNGTTAASMLGRSTKTITQANLPSYTLPNTLGLDSSGATPISPNTGSTTVAPQAAGALVVYPSTQFAAITITGGVQSGGSGTVLQNMSPGVLGSWYWKL